LGLFITKEIIEKMDGEIKAYSLAGHGSTFIVCIPSFYLTVWESQRQSLISIDQLKSKGLKCLIVDDAPFNLTLMRLYMNRMKIDVHGTSESGNNAFEIFMRALRNNKKIDLLMTDLDMPNGDGRYLCS
jgi:PleD family two-component response regulator